MKRIFCVLVMCAMMFNFAGCQPDNHPTDNTTQSTQPSGPEQTHPTVYGTFMQPVTFADYTEERMIQHLQNLKDVGVELLILQSTFHYNGNVTKTFFEDTFAQEQLADTYNRSGVGFMETVLFAAKSLDMQVYIGLANDADWWKKIFTDEAWLNDHVDISLQAARQIYDGYKTAYPDTLTGWYFWPEYWNMDCNAQETALAAKFLSDYRDGLYNIDPNMPMLLSPFISGSGTEPEKTESFWTQVLSTSTLCPGDIFCCQDSVGAGHIEIDQLDAYFAAMKAAADTKEGLKFWANNEDFTPEYKSADMGRFSKQLEITSKYADTHISFAFCHYRNPDTGKTNAYEAYKYYYETGTLEKNAMASPDVTVESVDQGFYVKFDITIDNAAGDTYGAFITKDGEEIYKCYFDSDADAAKQTLTANYTDLNMDVGPTQIFYTIYTMDFYGNISEEDVQIVNVYTKDIYQ